MIEKYLIERKDIVSKQIEKLNEKIECKKHMGICFETQNYADALRFLPDKAFITTPDSPYIQKTKFIFNVK